MRRTIMFTRCLDHCSQKSLQKCVGFLLCLWSFASVSKPTWPFGVHQIWQRVGDLSNFCLTWCLSIKEDPDTQSFSPICHQHYTHFEGRSGWSLALVLACLQWSIMCMCTLCVFCVSAWRGMSAVTLINGVALWVAALRDSIPPGCHCSLLPPIIYLWGRKTEGRPLSVRRQSICMESVLSPRSNFQRQPPMCVWCHVRQHVAEFVCVEV